MNHKPPYMLKALAADNPFDVYREAMNDMKSAVGHALGQYSPMDIPLVVCTLRFLAAGFENHPTMACDSAHKIVEQITASFSVISTRGLHRAAEEKDGANGGADE